MTSVYSLGPTKVTAESASRDSSRAAPRRRARDFQRTARIPAAALAILAAAALAAPMVGCSDAATGARTTGDQALSAASFVTAQGNHLSANGKVFNFSGANSLGMLDSQASADQYFASFQATGVNVVRVWAFGNGQAPNWQNGLFVFNETPGTYPPKLDYPEDTWRRLDYVVKRAGDLHIKLILTLGNYWDEYGGINMLAQWAGFPPEKNAYFDREQFYRSDRTKALYAAYVQRVVTRVNTLTGVAYRDDPAILLWEPLNEPRGRSDTSGQTVSAWINWAAGVIKSNDPNHLVGGGDEGFMTSTDGVDPAVTGFDYGQYPFNADQYHQASRTNPLTHQAEPAALVPEGSYFLSNCSQPNVDVCSIHAWPYNWFAVDKQAPDVFVDAWIRAHTGLMAKKGIQKPLYLGEFGLQVVRGGNQALAPRDKLFQVAYAATQQQGLSGSAFWNASLAQPSWLNWQLTFDVICNGPGATDSTCQQISTFGSSLASP